MRPLFAILASAVAVWLWPATAQACSCTWGTGDLHHDLKESREFSSAIYRARILSATPDPFRGRAVVEVLEVFKGKLVVGEQFELPSGGGGDCTIRFEADTEHLIYAYPEGPRAVWLCSRTRQLTTQEDSELEWLRTGKLPVSPAAIQRESVSCAPCSIAEIGCRMTTLPGERCDRDEHKAEALMKEGRPFLTDSNSARSSERQVMVGRSLDGRPFELIQTPYYGVDERCTQKVFLRWCKHINVTSPCPGAEPLFRCVEPGISTLECDETKSRTSKWGPPEARSAAHCTWDSPDNPHCEFKEPPRPLPEGTPTSPVLVCSPGQYRSYLGLSCRVQDAPNPLRPK